MALNPFFLQGSKSEQNLVQQLINEQLRMYGVEIIYMPRQYISSKDIIRENILARFDERQVRQLCYLEGRRYLKRATAQNYDRKDP